MVWSDPWGWCACKITHLNLVLKFDQTKIWLDCSKSYNLIWNYYQENSRKKKRKKEKKINAFLFIVRYQKNFFKKRGRSASLITVRMQGISTKRRGGEKKKWKIKITQTVLFQMFIQGQIDLSKSEKYLYTK